MKPWATLGIAAATALAFLWLSSRPDEAYLRAVDALGVKPGASTPISFVGAPVVHLSWSHLGLNMVLLLVFGPAVEKRAKGWGLLLIYVLSGIAGAAAHLAWVPSGQKMMTLVGASGAVSGVMGAHLALRPWGKVSISLASLWAFANLAGLLVLDRAGARGVSFLCHLGGQAAGALIGAALLSIRPAKPRKAF